MILILFLLVCFHNNSDLSISTVARYEITHIRTDYNVLFCWIQAQMEFCITIIDNTTGSVIGGIINGSCKG